MKPCKKNKQKKSANSYERALNKKVRQRLTLPGFTLVPSALVGLTALFGMGRGGPHRHSRLKVLTDLKYSSIKMLDCALHWSYVFLLMSSRLFQYRWHTGEINRIEL